MTNIILLCSIHGDLTTDKTIILRKTKELKCRKCQHNARLRKYNNKPERKARMKEYLEENRERIRERHKEYYKRPDVKDRYKHRLSRKMTYRKLKKYGITEDQYNEKLKEQNFVCEICKEPEIAFDKKQNKIRVLAIDHCHKTNKIRGLLCGKCNLTLGRMNENILKLKSMIDYIIKYNN